jgi:tRNA modification GTPase
MAFSTQDTIVAVATPPGRGGIGVVRLSGPDAQTIAAALITHREILQPRHATLSKLRPEPDATSEEPSGADTIDHVVATLFPAPHSYTGEDVVELSAHGSPVVLRAIVTAALGRGARLAEPGEFTLRAFLNGRIDLAQAEAVNDLIEAATPLQARAAFDQLDGTLTRAIAAIDAALFDLIARLEASVDFPEEGYHFVEAGAVAAAIDGLLARTAALLGGARRGRLIREGLRVAITGEPNVGKSSLFNALAGASRAIVTDVPGTTRDLVTEVIDLEGLQVTLIDTAGLRDTVDPIEREGVVRARQAIAVSDVVLRVEDLSRPRMRQDVLHCKVLCVANKGDLPRAWRDDDAVCVSCATGEGIDELRHAVVAMLDVEHLRDRPALTNVRHIALVERAQAALIRGRDAAGAAAGSMPEEFVLADLADARSAFEEISGRRAPDDLLEHIFSKFCIGK